jgi:hypothetical protein
MLEPKLYMNSTKNLIEPKLYMNPTKNLIELKLYMNPTKNLIEPTLYMNVHVKSKFYQVFSGVHYTLGSIRLLVELM